VARRRRDPGSTWRQAPTRGQALHREAAHDRPVRFQAEYANDCWQFDLSPSDPKQVPAPLWIEAGRGPTTLMLFSVVDERSCVAYQEYRCVYGEDVAAALHFCSTQ
jgi:hypothetical protein